MIGALLKWSEYSAPESLIANFYVLILTVFRNLGKKCRNYSWKSVYFLQFITHLGVLFLCRNWFMSVALCK